MAAFFTDPVLNAVDTFDESHPRTAVLAGLDVEGTAEHSITPRYREAQPLRVIAWFPSNVVQATTLQAVAIPPPRLKLNQAP